MSHMFGDNKNISYAVIKEASTFIRTCIHSSTHTEWTTERPNGQHALYVPATDG